MTRTTTVGGAQSTVTITVAKTQRAGDDLTNTTATIFTTISEAHLTMVTTDTLEEFTTTSTRCETIQVVVGDTTM